MMNGLIGNNDEVKLILLSCDDESTMPTKKEIRAFFPNSSVNIYKATGPFRDSFWEIESLLNIRLKGIESQQRYGRSKYFTHAIRLNKNSTRSIFFDLKYSEFVVCYLTVTPKTLENLSLTLKAIGKVNWEISAITDCVEKFKQVKGVLNSMGLNDPKVDNPCPNAVSTLFDEYGKHARERMSQEIDSWYEKNYWT
jgi:hypothetical protein